MPRGVYIRTDSAKQCIREAALRRPPVSDATKCKLRKRRHSAETKNKIGVSVTGEKNGMFGRPSHMKGKFGERAPMFGRRGVLSPVYRDKHPCWKHGVPTSYQTIHDRVRMLYGPADCCENVACKRNSTTYDWSNKDHRYDSLDRDKWQMLCTSCHRKYDYDHNGRTHRK